ncbi:MAG TPA: ketol-acid reductoisomerase, partial [Candidatus Bathyarchaeia archaeon]|nr:ketol-acid reductoisomerase [Candidatus Bathyarchaeia archaeon]
MAKLDFGGVKEDVITRKEFTVEQAQKILKDEVIVSLGYGIQGRAQSLNMRDNGVKVIIGQENTGVHKAYYDLAVQDGWVPGKTLFSMEEAAKRGTIKMFLLTDAGQRDAWPLVKKTLKEGDALYFSHGFSIVYSGMTGVVAPKNVDVILVAPKGSGTSVRRNFVDGSGINSSFAVYQNFTGKADDRVKAIGIAIGSGYLFPTTFEKEVYSDLTGERGVLMGALAGIMEAQYNTLREHGHSPS